jgi:hypothetical protein
MQFLGGEAYEQTDAAFQAADDLRGAIRIYDADPTHTASVVDVVSSSAPHDGASQARRVSRHDPSTTLLLELSEILRTLRSQARQQPTT